MNYSSTRCLSFTTVLILFTSACASVDHSDRQAHYKEKLAKLEVSSGGRIGVSIINTKNGRHLQYRAEEPFPLWSAFKIIPVSAILKRSMTNTHLLKERVTYDINDVAISGYAPITEKHVATGMTIGELCAAAIQYSDNAAINLLMKKLGGPDAITAFARSIGDNTFKFYRLKSELNAEVYPINLRFTSTAGAMEITLQRLALGNALALPQREQLLTWLKGNTTGDSRIRAGVPKGWVVGDKTGTGLDYGATNDIGIIWPPNRLPIILAVYFITQKKEDTVHHDEVIASVTQIMLNEVQ